MAHADDERAMLTLAALTYRGFHDVLGGRLHEGIVSGAVLDGLQTLVPVKDEWELVWGPATDRDRGQIADSNAMYVVRSRPAPHRFVVAIRGTNPISLSDWVFGDFWVGEMIDWPYATAAEPATTVLAIGGKPGEAYTPSAWEWYFEAERFRDPLDPEAALRLMDEANERFPDHAGVMYSTACWLALAGRDDEDLAAFRERLDD